MKSDQQILHVGSYAEPEPIGSNRTMALLALSLRSVGVSAEILTWPINDTWRGPVPSPKSDTLAGQPYLCINRLGIPYHVVGLPRIWSERSLTHEEWEEAVSWGMKALEQLRPQILHLQFWQNLWWILEAGIRLEIPTFYSAHDWGIVCHRMLLLTGWRTLCDGIVGVEKCSRCMMAGRKLKGLLNEFVAHLPFARPLLRLLFGKNGYGPLARVGGIRFPVQERIAMTIERCKNMLPRLNGLIVSSPFGRDFFQQFGIPLERVHVIPWFFPGDQTLKGLPEDSNPLVLAFAGRLSPEKGLHILLQALTKINGPTPVTLKIAGDTNSAYARDLMRRFPDHAGPCRVSWHGWIVPKEIPEFYADVHVAVIPSLWYDNTPLSLTEALAHGRPVICTDVPSMTHLVQHEVNGLVFPFADADALATQIQRLAASPSLLRQLSKKTKNVCSAIEYAGELKAIYCNILGHEL